MSEFITIQVGQCGNQIGSAFWPLVLQEYGIRNLPEGIGNVPSGPISNKELQSSFPSFFNIDTDNRYSTFLTLDDLTKCNVKARAVLIDMEDSVLSRYRSGPLKDLFHRKCIVTNYPGSGNNWAEGFCYHGPQFKHEILNSIRYAAEKCDSLHGILVLFSVGGGTGSGLGSYVVNLLSDYFSSVDRFVTSIYPLGTEDVITCPYNMALATEQLLQNATCVFPVENQALLDIIAKQLNNSHSSETIDYINKCKPFQDMNSIIVNMLLHLTSGSRFAGNLNVDMNEINTNMVPFPNLNFLTSGFSPLTVSSKSAKLTTTRQQIKDELFLSSCSRQNHLLKVDVLGPNSCVLGMTLIGRGAYTISDMRGYVLKLQSKAQFTPWSTKAIKVGLCNVPPAGHDISMFSLFNSTSVVNLFETVTNQFKRIYQKKAHVHHYTQVSGFDEDSFDGCYDSILNSINAYNDMKKVKPMKISRLTKLKV